MRAFLYVLFGIGVMAMAFWAYRENNLTRAALREAERLQDEIGLAREALRLQRAEWAYLNRPERLRDLAELNFGDLGLMPLEPGHFGTVEQVAYPKAALPPVSEPVDVIGTFDAEHEKTGASQ